MFRYLLSYSFFSFSSFSSFSVNCIDHALLLDLTSFLPLALFFFGFVCFLPISAIVFHKSVLASHTLLRIFLSLFLLFTLYHISSNFSLKINYNYLFKASIMIDLNKWSRNLRTFVNRQQLLTYDQPNPIISYPITKLEQRQNSNIVTEVNWKYHSACLTQ